ncbi:hypothetical protein EV424DRAFT_1344802 [Suillus variegatus]|nr:hypothetical protein EV424DRAFT_1344802 [Suillus variegatus]
MKRTRVRGQKEPAHTSSTIVPAPTPLPKGKRKHTNSVTEEPKKLSNEGRVQQPLQPLRQHDSKKAKLTPKLSKAYRAPNLLQRDKDLLGNYKRVQDDAAESDLDLDEDGEDRDGRDSLLDDNDKDEELADLTVDNLDDEGVQWTNKSAKNHYVVPNSEPEDEDPKALKSARAKKLLDEMPQFVDDTDKKPLTGSNRATDSMSQDGTAWMSDTDLEVTFRGNVPFISIKLQSDKVCKVVRGSYERGQRMFAFGLEEDADLTVDNVFAMVTPFATRGTDILAYEALVESADHEGYFGEDDMAERLLNDSWSQYAKPLIDYTAHRIHLCRTQFKKAIGQTIMSVLNLATNSAAENAKLLEDVNYIYPWSAKKDRYDTSKPFQAEVIKEGVRAGFFVTNQYSDLGLKFSHLLTSSLSTAPDKLEVTNHMIAAVATAVEANILDFNGGKNSEFVGPSHDNTFKAHMLLLLIMKEKKPLEYHKLAHGIYRTVIGIRNVGPVRLSKEQIIARVDWANMGGESD